MTKTPEQYSDGLPQNPEQVSVCCSRGGRRCNWYFNRLFSFPLVHASDDKTVLDVDNRSLQEQDNVSQMSILKEWNGQNDVDLNESGWDRVRQMFRRRMNADKDNQFSPDIDFISQVTSRTFALTFIVTGAYAAREGKRIFIEKSQGEKFKTKFIANRKMHDATIKAGLSAGLRYGLKAAVVTASIMTISHSIAAYRNKSSPFEYAAGAAIVMGIWRSYYGVRGLIAGSILGGTFGLVFGVAAYGLLKSAGFTQEQRRLMAIQEQWEQKHAWKRAQQEIAESLS